MPFDGCAIFGNCAGTILADITKFSVAPIYHRFRYLTRCKKNVELLRNQIQHLRGKRDGVQGAVDVATRNGEEILAEVQTWLTEVEKFMAEAEKLDGEFEEKKIYLKWWHFNLRLRYKLSKEARRISYSVEGLHGGVRVENAPPPGIEAMPAVLPAGVESLSVSLPAPPPGIEFMSSQDFMAFESTKSTLNQILEALMDESCNMVGLYGMGGVGKTTLVKEVGKKVEGQLFDQVVMAVVSQNQDVRKIQDQIADKLGLKLNEESETGRAGRLHARLKNEKRVLIILDDVWARLDLKAVGIPHGPEHKGCKIVLTTRRIQVCTSMGIQTKKIPVNILLDEESWDLFRKHVGVDIESTPLNVPAKAVVGECKGLPIALVTVGRALRDKDLEEWNAAVRQLKKSKAENIEGLDHDVFSCIKLSYDYLPGEETKLCFLFCCLFPEDYDIKIERLVRYAMGKGLIKDVDTMIEARSQVHSIIKNLIASCMLLESDKEGCVKMHDIVRDVAISIASSGGSHDDLFLVKSGAGLEEWPRIESFESYTGISLWKNDFKELPQGLECPKLKILLLGENEGLRAIPESFFEGMGMLKVLDLSKRFFWLSERTLSLPSSLKFLVYLRTLHLDNCYLSNLSAVGMLKKLEILSFVGSDIRALPEEIGELINLRLLDLTLCKDLEKIPPNVISKLTRLEELYMGGTSFRDWEVEEGRTREERSSASLSELKLLLRLTILCIPVNDVACFPKNNLLSPNFQKFAIEVRHDGNFMDFWNLYPNSNSLYLECEEAPLTDDFKTLIQMVEVLTLSKFKMRGSFDNILAGYCDAAGDEGLNGLKFLKLRRCDGIESLIDTYQWNSPVIRFAKLEKLRLMYLNNMEVICRGGLIPDGSFENLRMLEIDICPKLRNLFSPSLAGLLNLETLIISGCLNLETIIIAEEEDTEEGRLLSNNNTCVQHPPVVFPNLKFILVEACKRLTSLFTIATARSLVKLQRVILTGSEEMLEIVSHDGREGEGDENKEILLPQLEELVIEGMPKLERFCPGGFKMDLPSLKKLEVNNCPMMKRNLAADATAYGLKSAPPNLVKVKVDEQTLDGAAIQNLFSKQ